IQDIPSLLEYFSQEISEQSGVPSRSFSSKAAAALQTYNWPGNVRQLKNAVEWTMIMKGPQAEGDFEATDLPPEITGQKPAASAEASKTNGDFMRLPLREARELFERDYLQSQVNRFGGNISKTAQFVGMERSALHRKLKSLQIIGAEKEDEEMPAELNRKSA